MTRPSTPAPAPGRRRQADLYCDQVAAISHWHTARRVEEGRALAARAAGATRELRLDLNRRLDVLRREHEALIQRTDEQLRESVQLLRAAAPRRAVLAHGNESFVRAVEAGLGSRGVAVVARPGNGADAVGVAVAEQPDLVLVGAVLPMMTGEQVIREVRAFAPCAVVAAQASYDAQVAVLLEAGARIAFTRRVCPADVARELCQLL